MNAVRDAVWPLLADGRIRPLVAKTFPLDQVRAAHEYFDSGDHVGKVLLVM
jgi:NADPH2:quinone reductase